MAAMTMIKILYNDCYGGFNFSCKFLEEYKARTGKTLDTYKALFRQGPDSIRCDPTAISIVEERGSEWASGDHSEIAIREIPAVFARYWTIEDYDGDETVCVDVSAALADILQTFMETHNMEELERQYKTVMEARLAMMKLPVAAAPEAVAPSVLKAESNVEPCSSS